MPDFKFGDVLKQTDSYILKCAGLGGVPLRRVMYIGLVDQRAACLWLDHGETPHHATSPIMYWGLVSPFNKDWELAE